MDALDQRLVAFHRGRGPSEVPPAVPWHGLQPLDPGGMTRTFCGLTPHTPGVVIGLRAQMTDAATRCRTCRRAEERGAGS